MRVVDVIRISEVRPLVHISVVYVEQFHRSVSIGAYLSIEIVLSWCLYPTALSVSNLNHGVTVNLVPTELA